MSEKITFIGQPKTIDTKYGEKEKISIKVDSRGDTWIGGFVNQTTKSWKVGDEVDIEIIENGKYLNFKTPKEPAGKLAGELNDLKKRLDDAAKYMLNLEKRIEVLENANQIIDRIENGAPF